MKRRNRSHSRSRDRSTSGSPRPTHSHSHRSSSSGRWQVAASSDQHTRRHESKDKQHKESLSSRGSEKERRGRKDDLESLPSKRGRDSNYHEDKQSGANKNGNRSKSINERSLQLSDGRVVVGFYGDEKLSIRGKAQVESLQGNFSILGYTLTPNGNKYRMFSPESHCALTIQATSGENALCADPAIVQLCKTTGTVNALAFSKLDDLAVDFVTGLDAFKDLFRIKLSSIECPKLAEIGVEVVDRHDALSLDIPDKYHRIAEALCKEIYQGGRPVLCVCGGVDTGKSTLARFLINTMLNHCGEVGHMECDVGQTEFTPAATVSLTLVKKPLLGPPFTHLQSPHRMVYVGQASPGDHPDHYIHSIQHVWGSYQKLVNKPPLIINTMGWNRGLGVQLLVDTLRLTQPAYLIQLNSSSDTKNYPSLSRQFVGGAPGWRSTPGDDVTFELLMVDSPVSPHKQRGRYVAKDHRDMATLSYLGQVATFSGQSLLSMQPYEVAWRDVALHVIHSPVVNSEILRVLNGSMVALCHVNQDVMVTSPDEHLPKLLRDTPVCDCLGYGVVRAINPQKKVLYIITPVTSPMLDTVNCLLSGSLTIPQTLILSQKLPSIPYMDSIKDVTGASSVKPRKHMPRKRPPSR